jgi:lipopolysaccharide transport system permease protein
MASNVGTIEPQIPIIRIEPRRGWIQLKLNELWAYRELLYFLIWRDLKVRYKQTALGAAWAIIQPLMTMLIFSLFFGRLAKVPSDGIPYPLFSFTALVPWTFFANGLTQSSNSLVGSANLITKVYFPRLLIPIGSVLAGIADFSLSFTMLIGMLFFYHVPLTARIFYVPCFVLLAMVAAMGVGLWLSALNVKYRDVRHTVPFLVQLWMFATPVAYPSSLLKEPWHSFYGLNPMAGAVEGLRWSMLGTHSAPGLMFFLSALAAVLILIGGLYYFRSVEKSFADHV